ncbi:uncharacterized protein LOC129289511 isoform X2 [Prosopis cineraria]|uniref:uncharacterized protein LOC129289511 isoform X2 n=1 Tax=Prosopis cineraria TaxID=364024 RepID=UPI00240F5D99|nr:uncharacterized protein LOC129289511 isoform X2 [Prosopis cineraria]
MLLLSALRWVAFAITLESLFSCACFFLNFLRSCSCKSPVKLQRNRPSKLSFVARMVSVVDIASPGNKKKKIISVVDKPQQRFYSEASSASHFINFLQLLALVLSCSEEKSHE